MSRPTKEINPKQAKNFKKFLEDTGIPQKELAKKIFISEQQISKIKNGKASLTMDVAEAINKVFPSYRVGWFLGYDEFETDEDFDNNTPSKTDAYILSILGRCFDIVGYELLLDNDGEPSSEDDFFDYIDRNIPHPDGFFIRRVSKEYLPVPEEEEIIVGHLTFDELNTLKDRVFDIIRWEIQRITGEWI